MKETACCFTGHRNLSEINMENLYKNALTAINSLIQKGVDTFICGGAIGFDIMCGIIISELKKTNKSLKLIMFLPHKTQDFYYSPDDKKLYNELKKVADKIIYTSQDYYDGCLQFRNNCMVENSSYLICFCTKHHGGSFYTREYAEKLNLKIINLTGDA